VDVVGGGVPYTDPVLDGPVIQRATEVALAAGVRTRDVLATVTELLNDESAGERWQRRRESYLATTVNLTDVIVRIALQGGAVEQIPAVTRQGEQPPVESAGQENSDGVERPITAQASEPTTRLD
jgi:hypothetical protein